MAEAVPISVIVPCLNEQDNVGPVFEGIAEAMREEGLQVEIVFVDDGSSDLTWERISLLIQRAGDPRMRGVRHEINRGIPAAWQSGLDVATGEYACFFDADLQYDPSDIVRLYKRLVDSEADIAQGVRISPEPRHSVRLLASQTLNALLNLTFGSKSRDSKSGLILGPRFVLEDVIRHNENYRYFQSFVSVAALARGYSILEVRTAFRERERGVSFLTGRMARASLVALADFLPAIREFRGRHHPFRYRVGPPELLPDHLRPPYRGWRRVMFETFFATMPLHKWMIRRSARQIYLDLHHTQTLDREALDELQFRKLRRLMQHAYSHVPHYREAMREAKIYPSDIESLDDLRSLPLLSKEQVRDKLYFDLFSDDREPHDLLKIVTSGSTGEPFTIFADRYQLETRFASTLRGLEWTGWKFGDRQARLWHQTLGMSWTQIIRERIDAWFMRRLFIPAYEIDPINIDEFISAIRDHDPVLVDGYAESLNFLASYVRGGGKPGFEPTAVMSSAQALSDSAREAIEEGFETRVFDKYGSREFSGIAYQCHASPDHHVMDESYIVELLVDGRPALPGETGEVVITDLNNFAVPLIRYRIGDLAVAVDNDRLCDCGRSLSRIGRIDGRTQAIVHCADGTWLPGTFFAHFFKEYEPIVRFFQIHQAEKGEFVLRIVENDDFSQEAFEEMLRGLEEYTGSETRINVEKVESIPLVRTGKRSPVVSEVDEDFQALVAASGAAPWDLT